MKRMLFAAAFAALLTALPAAAELETYTIDPNHTFPTYEISHFGYSMQRGRFNKTSGKITLDTAAKKGSADVTIDAASIDSGVREARGAPAQRGILQRREVPADHVQVEQLRLRRRQGEERHRRPHHERRHDAP